MIAKPSHCPECVDSPGWRRRGDTPLAPVERCACYLARVAAERLAAAKIPWKYQRCSLENYRPYTESLQEAHAACVGLAQRFPSPLDAARPAGMLLLGRAGTGKTHLAAALLQHIVVHTHCSGVFFRTRDLLRLMRASYSPETQTTEAQVLAPLLTCDLLVLDDLGAERLTAWADDTMNDIVDTRYAEGRPLIATSNFPDLDDPDDARGLQWRIGFRMYSRLCEMCRFVTLDGADFRKAAGRLDNSDAALHEQWKAQPQESATRPAPPGRVARSMRAKDGAAHLGWSGGKYGNTE